MIDRRWVARQIATRLIASRVWEGNDASGTVVVQRNIIERYVAEYTQKYGVPFDKRMEKELNKYGIHLMPPE